MKRKITYLMLVILLFSNLPARIAYSAEGTLEVTATGTYKNLDLRYIGDNSSNTVLQGNIAKYYGDVMFNMYRAFSGINYSPVLTNAVVNGKSDFDAAVAAVKANGRNNPYITTTQIEKDIVDYLAAQPDFVRTFASIRRSTELGIDTLKVTGPWGGTPNSYGLPLFNVWRNAFAQGYIYGLAGVKNFNAGNEPDLIGITNYAGYAVLLAAQIDGLKAGAEAANVDTPLNWGPTFAAHNTTTNAYLDTLLDHIDPALIDVYDFHQYGGTRAGAGNTINMFKDKSDTDKPVALTEFNWILAPKVEPDMGDATNSAKFAISLIRAGSYAPLRFMFTKTNKDTSDGQPSSGIISVDDASLNATRGTKIYYSSRMINRFVDANNITDLTQFQEADYTNTPFSHADTEIMIVKTPNAYNVIIENRETTASQSLTIDLSALGVTNGSVIVREVSDMSDDEVTGTLPVMGGKFTATVYSKRVYLFSIPSITASELEVPKVFNAYGHTGGVDIWWKNQAIVTNYKVERQTAGSSGWQTLDNNVNHSFYTDATAMPGIKYYYRVTPGLMGANGLAYGPAAKNIGPLARETDLYSLPYSLDFEDKTTGNLPPDLDGFQLVKSIDDMGLISPPDQAKHTVLTGSDQWTNYSLAIRFHLENQPATIPADPGSPINQEGLETETKAGVYLRYQDKDNYYRIEYDKNGTTDKGKGTVTLYKKKDGGEEAVLKSITSPITVCDSFDIRNIDGVKTIRLNAQSQFIVAEIEKNRIAVNFGTTVTPNTFDFEVFDPDPIPSGKVGLFANSGVAFFDGIQVNPLLTENFQDDSNNTANWNIVNGLFNIETLSASKYYISRNNSPDVCNIATAGETYWKDYWFNAAINFWDISDEKAKALLFYNYIDEDNYYRIEFAKNGMVSIIKRRGGEEATLATGTTTAFVAGNEYIMNVNVVQGKSVVEINGRSVVNANDFDNSIPKGKIGIGSMNAEIAFDRISLCNIFPAK